MPLRQPPLWLSSLCDAVGTVHHMDTHSKLHWRTWASEGASPTLPRAQSRVIPTQRAICAPAVSAGVGCPATAVSTLTQAHLPAHLVNSWLWCLEPGL